MTYRSLRDYLNNRATEEQLDQEVTVSDIESGEYYPARLDTVDDSDVLDIGHLVIWFPLY
jgi:hypothetical protein